MKCVRCNHDAAECAAQAPDGSAAWKIYVCHFCNFSWRDTEEPETIDPRRRDPYFQLDDAALETMSSPIPLPSLREDLLAQGGEGKRRD